RVAHPEDFDLAVKNPDGSPGHKHEDFMEMTACFRCHSLEDEALAPGSCASCHPKDFDLKPANHDEADFVRVAGEKLAPHAEMAREDIARVEAASHEGEADAEHQEASLLGIEKAYASGGGEHETVTETVRTEEGWQLVPVSSVSYCST